MRQTLAIATIAVSLLCGTQGQARRAATPAAAAPAHDRVADIRAGDAFEMQAAAFDATMGRMNLDVRFGPADVAGPTRSVWLSDGLGRDSSMRRAGIARLVVVRHGDIVRIVAETPASAMAAR
jgi:hypothetical protein